MKPNEQIEEAYAKIALIESFYVLMHDREDVYLVVEKKHIPENALIIESPVFKFLHESLVTALEKCGAKFRLKHKVKIVNKALNEERYDYLIAKPETSVKFKGIHEVGYVPSAISELEEDGSIFFSKEAVEKMRQMGLRFEELPSSSLIPLY